MNLISKKNIFWIIFFILWGVTAGITIHRSHSGSNDFDTFYLAGQSVLQGEGIYYAGEYYQAHADRGPFLYPPFAACFFAVLALFPLSLAAFLWNTINFFLLFFAFKWIARLCGFEWGHYVKPRSMSGVFFYLLLGVMAVALALDNLVMAQANILVVALCLGGLLLGRRGKPVLSGVILGIAVMVKVTPVFFGIYFIAKRQWRVLAGMFVGLLVCSLLIPTLVFGLEQSRIYHRQWLGRMIKPITVKVLSRLENYEPHPKKPSLEDLEYMHMTDMLVDKNQSLKAAMMRLFLKDRNEYAESTEYPIYVARRYRALPVLLGGVEKEKLQKIFWVISFGILLGIGLLWMRKKTMKDSYVAAGEMSLAFLLMTLLSPLARSHQLIAWILPIAFLGCLKNKSFCSSHPLLSKISSPRIKISIALTLIACIFYLGQALPYGKAAGLGAWTNILLLLAVAQLLAQLKFQTGAEISAHSL